MPVEPKAPYKLTVKLDGAKPELVAEALTELRNIASSLDQTGDASATMMIEGYQEHPLDHIMAQFETWLYDHAIGLDCDMTIKRPGIRPETIARRMREKHTTPMDQILKATPGARVMDFLVEREQRGGAGGDLFDDAPETAQETR